MPRLREKIKNGPQLGLGMMYPSPGSIERICPDWDCIWIDAQHGELGYQDVMLIVQIETPEALDNVEAIAAVPGIDALFLGPDDVLLRRGQSMTSPRSPAMLELDMSRMARACRNQGKVAATVAVGGDMIRMVQRLGYQMIVTGGDVSFLANGSKAASSEARAILADNLKLPAESPIVQKTLY